MRPQLTQPWPRIWAVTCRSFFLGAWRSAGGVASGWNRWPAGTAQHFVLVRPREGLSTAAVYRQTQCAERSPRASTHVGRVLQAGRPGTCRLACSIVCSQRRCVQRPSLERLQREFGRVDVLGHQLSGSGSGYFGVCRHAKHARRVADVLRARSMGRVFRVLSVGAAGRVRRRTSQN